MITTFQAIILGLIQGLAELFPISSLGHSVILPSLFGWNIHQDDAYFLTFLVALHLATALVLFGFFWKDWLRIFKGLGRSITARKIAADDFDAKVGWLLVVATIPAGLLGIALQKKLETLFASPRIAAGFLIVNGLVLLLGEKLRKRGNKRANRIQSDEKIARLNWTQAIGIGLAQACALIPGISRSGASMSGGLLAGLNNEDAARFTFLLATPVIGGAALLKLPELFKPAAAPERTAILWGAIFAAIAAYFAVRFLVKYFQANTLKPFAIYCLVAGVAFSAYLTIR